MPDKLIRDYDAATSLADADVALVDDGSRYATATINLIAQEVLDRIIQRSSATPASVDSIPIYDDSATAAARVTIAALTTLVLDAIGALGEISPIDDADSIAAYDASATAAGRVTVSDLAAAISERLDLAQLTSGEVSSYEMMILPYLDDDDDTTKRTSALSVLAAMLQAVANGGIVGLTGADGIVGVDGGAPVIVDRRAIAAPRVVSVTASRDLTDADSGALLVVDGSGSTVTLTFHTASGGVELGPPFACEILSIDDTDTVELASDFGAELVVRGEGPQPDPTVLTIAPWGSASCTLLKGTSMFVVGDVEL